MCYVLTRSRRNANVRLDTIRHRYCRLVDSFYHVERQSFGIAEWNRINTSSQESSGDVSTMKRKVKPRNPVAKYARKYNKAKVFRDRTKYNRKKLKEDYDNE